jgi:hypothetical protein
MRIIRIAFASAVLVGLSASAWAKTIQVPEGGAAISWGRGVLCGGAPQGWALDDDREHLRPPAPDAPGVRETEIKIAPEHNACAQSSETVTLIATAPLPEFDSAGTVLYADDGRIDLKGQRLKGLQILWQAGNKTGQDTCLDPQGSKQQTCVVPVGRGLSGEVSLRWLPARAVSGADVVTYDRGARRVDPASWIIRPARVVLSSVFGATDAVDVSQGPGRVPLVHPEAIASVDCGQARCELTETDVLVRSFPASATSVTMRLRLLPRFTFVHGENHESSVTAVLPLLHCPLSIVSGPPLRGDVESGQVVVRMDARCASGTRLRWLVDGNSADLAKAIKTPNETYFLVRTGRLLRERVNITATRADMDGMVVGVLDSPTVAAPRPRVVLELPKYGPIDFVPTNRNATMTVSGAREHARLIPVSVEGDYTVTPAPDGKSYLVHGDPGATGLVSLRFGYRPEGLPPELTGTNTALIDEPVNRALREASVPAPFSTSAQTDKPLVEMVCADEHGKPQRLETGKQSVIPYEQRGTCQVIIHRERLSAEDGMQEVVLDVDVTDASGAPRSAAALHERLVLRPGGETQIIPLKGGLQQFDQMSVRVSLVIDETRYTLGPLARSGIPSVQWTAIVEGGRARLYATVDIPAGLYRLNSPSGQLTLNFGILSRLVSLNKLGKESLLGLELGLMGMSLVQPASETQYPRTLGILGGLGIRVPLGSGAAVAVHAWAVYELRANYRADGSDKDASHFGIVFGPSISVGNVGANL